MSNEKINFPEGDIYNREIKTSFVKKTVYEFRNTLRKQTSECLE